MSSRCMQQPLICKDAILLRPEKKTEKLTKEGTGDGIVKIIAPRRM